VVVGGLGQAGTLHDAFAYAPAAALQTPMLTAAEIDAQDRVAVRGGGFRPAASASGDATHQSATNAPLVQLRHLDSERLVYPGQAVGALFTGAAITTTALTGAPTLRNGPVVAAVFVNGVATSPPGS
jgi:hypothetical protein